MFLYNIYNIVRCYEKRRLEKSKNVPEYVPDQGTYSMSKSGRHEKKKNFKL